MKLIEPYVTKIVKLEIGQFYYDSSPQLEMEWGVGHMFMKVNYETVLIASLEEIMEDEEMRFRLAETEQGEPKLVQLWSEADLIQLRLWLMSMGDIDDDDRLSELEGLLKTSFQELTISQFYRVIEITNSLKDILGVYEIGKNVEKVFAAQWIRVEHLALEKQNTI